MSLNLMEENNIVLLLQSFVVIVSGERLISRLRVQLFGAMLYQSVGWHDDEKHTTGSLTTILSNDADKVKNVS